MLPTPVRRSLLAARRLIHIHEPHPFFIYPTTMKPMPTSIRFYTTRLGRAASMYVPAAVVIFGWSLAGAATINWSHGVSNKGLWNYVEGPKEMEDGGKFMEMY